MNIAQSVQNTVAKMPAGQIFGYSDLPRYSQSPEAVIKAVNRMVSEKRLERFAKGKFYVPKQGLLGRRKPSDIELIRAVLYKNGRLRGYVSGLTLYNRLGLTTQMRQTVTVACNCARQEKDFGTIRIKILTTRVPVQEEDVPLLQYLDVFKDIKSIPDADINMSLKIMSGKLSTLSEDKQSRLVTLALEYYGPQVRALIGMLYSSLGFSRPKGLAPSLNPTTTYKLNLDQDLWPTAKDWNIR